MKTLVSLAIVLLLSIGIKAQSFYFPAWDDDASFKTVKLKFEEKESKKVVFDGYKDSYITIKQILAANNRSALLSITGKISGYLQFEDAPVLTMQLDQTLTDVRYMMSIYHKDGIVLISVAYKGFNEAKPQHIIVMQQLKNKKTNFYTLTGFE